MSSSKNILMMISSLGGGGAERVACRLASQLAEHNDVWLMPFSSTERPYPVSSKVHLVDESLYDLRERKPQPWQFLRLARTALHMLPIIWRTRRQEHIDTTISMLLAPNIMNLIAPGGSRRVLCERNNPARKGALRLALSKWAYAHADCVVFQSRHVRDLFSDRVRGHSAIVPNPVEVARRAAPPEEREQLVVSAGRLVPQKNHALLIHAFARFHETHPHHRLAIFGDGPLREDLQSLIDGLGLSGSVCLEHFCNDLHERIATAQMFVLSSDFEGMPNSLLEAMTMGLACITTAYPASEELVEDGANALVVPTGDEAALATALVRIADDADLRGRLERGALERSRDFSMDVVIPQWETLL